MLPEDWFDQIRKAYPKRSGGQGWGHVRKIVPRLIENGESFEDLLDGAKRYATFMRATSQERSPYVMQARTFFGPGEWWMEEYELPSAAPLRGLPKEISAEEREADIRKFEQDMQRFKVVK